MWDARSTGLSGSKIEKILELCHISVNKNTVIGDTSAATPGGVRLGTPAMTTRGMKESDMELIAAIIQKATNLAVKIQAEEPNQSKKLVDFIKHMKSDTYRDEIASIVNEVHSLSKSFPLPGIKPSK